MLFTSMKISAACSSMQGVHQMPHLQLPAQARRFRHSDNGMHHAGEAAAAWTHPLASQHTTQAFVLLQRSRQIPGTGQAAECAGHNAGWW